MTDPIAAARALIKPLTGYTPRPWCKHGNGKQIVSADTIIASCVWGAVKANTRLIAAAPDLRDMVATLADAVEVERAEKVTLRRAIADGYNAEAVALEKQTGLALVAAAFAMQDAGYSITTPADAQAALDKLLAEAWLEGWRAGRDAATEPLTSLAAVLRKSENSYHQSQASAMLERADAIRALPEPKEASNV